VLSVPHGELPRRLRRLTSIESPSILWEEICGRFHPAAGVLNHWSRFKWSVSADVDLSGIRSYIH
jgi:hypothetical protein